MTGWPSSPRPGQSTTPRCPRTEKKKIAFDMDHMEADDKGWEAANLDESAWEEKKLPARCR